MLICQLIEAQESALQQARLGALARFIEGRLKDENVKREIDVPAFINIAQSLQIPISQQQLEELYLQPPLNNLIRDIQDGKVIFHDPNADAKVSQQMSVDQAQKTVDTMAKRATNNAMKGLT